MRRAGLVLVCIAMVWMGGLLVVGCEQLACRDHYRCQGYICDPVRVVCKTQCASNADCDVAMGYRCTKGRCACDPSRKGAYCHTSCRVARDCLKIDACKNPDPNAADTFSGGGVCTCQDPCYDLHSSCLDSKAGQTPISAPKQCYKDGQILMASTDPEPSSEGGDADGGARAVDPDEDSDPWGFEDDAGDAPEHGEQASEIGEPDAGE